MLHCTFCRLKELTALNSVQLFFISHARVERTVLAEGRWNLPGAGAAGTARPPAPPRRTVHAAPPRGAGLGAVPSAGEPTPSPAPRRRADLSRPGGHARTAPEGSAGRLSARCTAAGDRLFQEVGNRRCREHSSLWLLPYGWDALPDPPRQADQGIPSGGSAGSPEPLIRRRRGPPRASLEPGDTPPHTPLRGHVRRPLGTRGRGTCPGKGRTGRAGAASAPSP